MSHFLFTLASLLGVVQSRNLPRWKAEIFRIFLRGVTTLCDKKCPQEQQKCQCRFPEFSGKKPTFFPDFERSYLRSPLSYRNATPLVGTRILLSIQTISLNFCSLKISTQNGPLKKFGNKKIQKIFQKVHFFPPKL